MEQLHFLNAALTIDTAGGCVTGHENIAEGIDGRLDQHIGNGEHGALGTGRQADAQHL